MLSIAMLAAAYTTDAPNALAMVKEKMHEQVHKDQFAYGSVRAAESVAVCEHYTKAFGPLKAVDQGIYAIQSSNWADHELLQSCVLPATASGQTAFKHDEACTSKAGTDENPFTTIGTYNDAFVAVEEGPMAGETFGAVSTARARREIARSCVSEARAREIPLPTHAPPSPLCLPRFGYTICTPPPPPPNRPFQHDYSPPPPPPPRHLSRAHSSTQSPSR